MLANRTFWGLRKVALRRQASRLFGSSSNSLEDFLGEHAGRSSLQPPWKILFMNECNEFSMLKTLVQRKNCQAAFSTVFHSYVLGQNGFSFLSEFYIFQKIRGKVKHQQQTIIVFQVFSKQQPAVFNQFSRNNSRSLKERIRIAS